MSDRATRRRMRRATVAFLALEAQTPHINETNPTKEQEREQAAYILASLPKIKVLRHLPRLKAQIVRRCTEVM